MIYGYIFHGRALHSPTKPLIDVFFGKYKDAVEYALGLDGFLGSNRPLSLDGEIRLAENNQVYMSKT